MKIIFFAVCVFCCLVTLTFIFKEFITIFSSLSSLFHSKFQSWRPREYQLNRYLNPDADIPLIQFSVQIASVQKWLWSSEWITWVVCTGLHRLRESSVFKIEAENFDDFIIEENKLSLLFYFFFFFFFCLMWFFADSYQKLPYIVSLFSLTSDKKFDGAEGNLRKILEKVVNAPMQQTEMKEEKLMAWSLMKLLNELIFVESTKNLSNVSANNLSNHNVVWWFFSDLFLAFTPDLGKCHQRFIQRLLFGLIISSLTPRNFDSTFDQN